MESSTPSGNTINDIHDQPKDERLHVGEEVHAFQMECIYLSINKTNFHGLLMAEMPIIMLTKLLGEIDSHVGKKNKGWFSFFVG